LKPARLGLAPLVAVMFFTVSGGPFGLEGLIGAVGPGVALTLIVATPLLYSVPEALLIGELASMLPVEGGYYEWVKRAFGPFGGFCNGWLSFAYSLVDMALYPVLFQQYLAFLFPGVGKLAAWAISLGLVWLATLLNLRGTRVVGIASGWFAAAVLLPFLVLAAAAAHEWFAASHVALPIEPYHTPGVSFVGALGSGISLSIWNYSGWDNPSTIEGELDDAGKNYPRALARTLPLVTLVYLISVLPVLAVTDYRKWTDGAWPALGTEVVGGWLGTWIAAAGMLSAFALFNALLLSYSRIPLVLAKDRLLPRALGVLDARGTPRRAVLLAATIYSVFALLPFADLLAADVILYTGALALEIAALLHFRRHEPELRGAFRVPVGRFGLLLIGLLPVSLIVFSIVLLLAGETRSSWPVVGTVALGAVGPILYLFFRPRKPPEAPREVV